MANLCSNSPNEEKKLLEKNKVTFEKTVERTKSLRESNPNIRVRESIYSKEPQDSSDAFSVRTSISFESCRAYQPSEIEFDFDDQLVNSQVYRRMLAKALAKEKDPIDHGADSEISKIVHHKAVTPEEQEKALGPAIEQLTQIIVTANVEGQLQYHSMKTASRPPTELGTREDTAPKSAEQDLSPLSVDQTMPVPRSLPSRAHPKCSKCEADITAQYVLALGKRLHQDCFTCSDCNKVLGTEFSSHEQEDGTVVPLCETDYLRRLGMLCHGCNEPVHDVYISAANRKYHVGHVRCEACNIVCGVNDTYYERKGKVYCLADFLKLAHRCAGCHEPILGPHAKSEREADGSIESDAPGVDYWHPKCLSPSKNTARDEVPKSILRNFSYR